MGEGFLWVIFWGFCSFFGDQRNTFFPSDHYFLKFAGFLLLAKFEKHAKIVV